MGAGAAGAVLAAASCTVFLGLDGPAARRQALRQAAGQAGDQALPRSNVDAHLLLKQAQQLRIHDVPHRAAQAEGAGRGAERRRH